MNGKNPIREIASRFDVLCGESGWRFAVLPESRMDRFDFAVSAAGMDAKIADSLAGGVMNAVEYISTVKCINIRLADAALWQAIESLAETRVKTRPFGIRIPFIQRYAQLRAVRYAQYPSPLHPDQPAVRRLACAALLADYLPDKSPELAERLLEWHEYVLAAKARESANKDTNFMQKDSIQSGETCAILARAVASVLNAGFLRTA